MKLKETKKEKKKKILQKDVWQLILRLFREWISYHHRIVYQRALEEAIEVIEDDNGIQISVEWKWKFRKRLDRKLASHQLEKEIMKIKIY